MNVWKKILTNLSMSVIFSKTVQKIKCLISKLFFSIIGHSTPILHYNNYSLADKMLLYTLINCPLIIFSSDLWTCFFWTAGVEIKPLTPSLIPCASVEWCNSRNIHAWVRPWSSQVTPPHRAPHTMWRYWRLDVLLWWGGVENNLWVNNKQHQIESQIIIFMTSTFHPLASNIN